jgi:AbrB family looped-hinge helix DNA binding protein
METLTVSKKYQILIPKKIRKQSGIKPRDKMIAITKHGIIQVVPIRPLKETEGFISGLDTKDLRDESDRID